jgi:hypothetical protein
MIKKRQIGGSNECLLHVQPLWQAFTRRERATSLIANLKASVMGLYYMHRDWCVHIAALLAGFTLKTYWLAGSKESLHMPCQQQRNCF